MCTARATIVVLGAVAILGCGGGGSTVTAPTADSDVVSTDAMADLSMVTGQMSEGSLDSEVDQMERQDFDGKDFTRVRDCPLGGDITIDGRLTRTVNGNVTEIEGRGIRTESDCVLERGGEPLTINGTARWDSFHRRVGGEPKGNQTTHWVGRSTFSRADGTERTCRVEITITRNPTSGRRTLEGTICGRQVSRSGSWEPRP